MSNANGGPAQSLSPNFQPVTFGVDANGNPQLYGGGAPVANIDYLGAFAWAGLPAAASYAGYRARVTDGGPTGGVYVVSDGVRWKPVNGTANLATLGAAVSGIATTETIVLQSLLPANFWQNNDILRVWMTGTKSGTTNSQQFWVRIGAAGTTADTPITGLTGFTVLGATQVSGGFFFDIKLVSATSALRLGNPTSGVPAYGGMSTATAAAATTITSAAANPLWVSLTTNASGAPDTVAVPSAQIQLVTS